MTTTEEPITGDAVAEAPATEAPQVARALTVTTYF
jgi:hypothetical protein